jgi:hypothetical protein
MVVLVVAAAAAAAAVVAEKIDECKRTMVWAHSHPET